MDDWLEIKCTCGNPAAIGVVHTTSGACYPEMHPSGMTMQRWNWPYKTPQERELVAKWFKKQEKTKQDNLDRSEF